MRAIPLWVKLLGGIGILAGACVALAFVPTGEVAYAPVAPIDLDRKITVDGAPVEPVQGRLSLVGVTEKPVNLLQRMLLDVGDPKVDFGPEPPRSKDGGPSAEDVDAMARAKEIAAAVAYTHVGARVGWSGNGATVDAVEPGTPAGAQLRPGDIIVRVNDVDVDTSVEASQLLSSFAPGAKVTLGVRRAGDTVRVELRTIPPVPGDLAHRSRIGVELSTLGLRIQLPHRVAIDTGEVVGPSGGLAFALYLADFLDAAHDLLRGRHVVATGALAPDGRVIAVGRIRQKATATQLAGEDVMLVPTDNAKAARAAIAAACEEGSRCTRVVPVGSVEEAVKLLELDDAALAAATNP